MILARATSGVYVAVLTPGNLARLQAGDAMIVRLDQVGGDAPLFVHFAPGMQEALELLQRLSSGKLPPVELPSDSGKLQ